MKLVGVRDVVEHSDVTIPTTNVFTSKMVKLHSVANYIFTFEAKKNDNLQ